MGVPWYGYNYQCIDTNDTQLVTCNIAQVPFRGVNCSDAAGHDIGYSSLMKMVNSPIEYNLTTKVRRDSYLQTPFFNYLD